MRAVKSLDTDAERASTPGAMPFDPNKTAPPIAPDPERGAAFRRRRRKHSASSESARLILICLSNSAPRLSGSPNAGGARWIAGR
jgi:hypothetical protein